MTVSLKVMSAGTGYRYLLSTVAVGDGDRDLSSPLTRYYSEEGTPPGRWLGGGIRDLDHGLLKEGDEVTEQHLELLLGHGLDPVTGDKLGHAYPAYREGGRTAVAGYDLTFSVPKSASVLWAVADAGTQQLIADAHHAAVAEVVAFLEREVAFTRTGATEGGARPQVEVTGLIAAAFDHYDSRAGDPHLHTHVVISNKVRTIFDGKWRSLDGRPLHDATVALSELHEGVFADHLTRALGVEWELRPRPQRDRNPYLALAAVPDELVWHFSRRAESIEEEKERLVDEYATRHGRHPDAATVLKLRQQATLATRPEKRVRSLAELTEWWRERATGVLGTDATAWARAITATTTQPGLLRCDDVPLEAVETLGRRIVAAVGLKRSTWKRWNLYAEAARQTVQWRFATTEDRETIVGLAVDAAERFSLRLTPPELAFTPPQFVRGDGHSVFRPAASVVYSSAELLEAEDRLVALGRNADGPTLALEVIEKVAEQPDAFGQVLSADQATALEAIAVSGRLVDVLVGPAGAGKTTALGALRRAWVAVYGQGSVVGLAPSAAAAAVLAADLGIRTENTAKWWFDNRDNPAAFHHGQLVIVDEASLAGTLALDRIASRAADAGAKVLLVGDWAQLQAVDAGGAFAMLVADRGDAPELTDIHRFVEPWETEASLQLRLAEPDSVDWYFAHDRVAQGTAAGMLDAAYAAWRGDREDGVASLLIASKSETVADLNRLARRDLIEAGVVSGGRSVPLHDGTSASTGDLVLTRRNDRRLRAGRDWVRNGSMWTVTGVRGDGSLTVRALGRRWGGAVVLPAAYVAEHVELGYAVTAWRAQGITVDRAHLVVEAGTTREELYVGMTRGRATNRAYVATDVPVDDVMSPRERPVDAYDVLTGVLRRSGAELSARETMAAEHEEWGSIAQLAAEYEVIASAAQRDRWQALLRSSGLPADTAEDAIASGAFSALAAELRRAEANGWNVDRILPAVVASRPFDDAADAAAVLRSRVAAATAAPPRSPSPRRGMPRRIAGIITPAAGPMADDMRRALDERRVLIENRASEVLLRDIRARAAWLGELGYIPRNPAARDAWLRNATIVAAYRDRYHVTGSTPLGPMPETTAQRLDAARAAVAMRRAHQMNWEAEQAHTSLTPQRPIGPSL